jgi:hypothetical protein
MYNNNIYLPAVYSVHTTTASFAGGGDPRHIEISSPYNTCDNIHFYGMKRSFNIHAVSFLRVSVSL